MSTQPFQAEVRQLLDIVIHSLYTDREIFIRELVSNASDALEKMRLRELTESDVRDKGATLEIQIACDEEAKTLTFTDTGIGMTREELVQNLGTIAHSGTKAFLQSMKEKGNTPEVIGQFGVGFYSAFMAASRVEVFTRSWEPNSEALKWESDGEGGYTIEVIDEDLPRGTRMVLHLKEDEFAKPYRVKEVLKKYLSGEQPEDVVDSLDSGTL
jgi:molecular chaperone HtpG